MCCTFFCVFFLRGFSGAGVHPWRPQAQSVSWSGLPWPADEGATGQGWHWQGCPTGRTQPAGSHLPRCGRHHCELCVGPPCGQQWVVHCSCTSSYPAPWGQMATRFTHCAPNAQATAHPVEFSCIEQAAQKAACRRRGNTCRRLVDVEFPLAFRADRAEAAATPFPERSKRNTATFHVTWTAQGQDWLTQGGQVGTPRSGWAKGERSATSNRSRRNGSVGHTAFSSLRVLRS